MDVDSPVVLRAVDRDTAAVRLSSFTAALPRVRRALAGQRVGTTPTVTATRKRIGGGGVRAPARASTVRSAVPVRRNPGCGDAALRSSGPASSALPGSRVRDRLRVTPALWRNGLLAGPAAGPAGSPWTAAGRPRSVFTVRRGASVRNAGRTLSRMWPRTLSTVNPIRISAFGSVRVGGAQSPRRSGALPALELHHIGAPFSSSPKERPLTVPPGTRRHGCRCPVGRPGGPACPLCDAFSLWGTAEETTRVPAAGVSGSRSGWRHGAGDRGYRCRCTGRGSGRPVLSCLGAVAHRPVGAVPPRGSDGRAAVSVPSQRRLTVLTEV